MINRIEILSPGKSCRKSKKIIQSIKKMLEDEKIEAELIIISDLVEVLKYHTWILPTILINGKIIARGYNPGREIIINNLK
ncbi:MAG: thioredoxin family protein [Bacteroidales bacterium]|nr:thioredoxin family protein [Bacteroidales bacterium]